MKIEDLEIVVQDGDEEWTFTPPEGADWAEVFQFIHDMQEAGGKVTTFIHGKIETAH